MPSVLIVCTSADKIGDKTDAGVWYEEAAGPYFVFKKAGFEIDFASPKGGQIPTDKGSKSEPFYTDDCKAFDADEEAQKKFNNSAVLSEVEVTKYDITFYSGGASAMVDFPDACGKPITDSYAAGKVVATVCHGPACLLQAMEGDAPLVKGKEVAVFTTEEEKQAGTLKAVPFLLEDKMAELGAAKVVVGAPWTSNTAVTDRLVTGQNPQSSVATAELAIKTAG